MTKAAVVTAPSGANPPSAAPEPWNLPAGFRGGDGTDRLVCANGRLSLELWTEYAYDLDARMFMA